MLPTEHGGVKQSTAYPTSLGAYNYRNFDQHVARGGDLEDEVAFRASPHAGDLAENFTLVGLDDAAQVRLGDLWRSKPLVMEFGSFT
jgi:hypothetical protein